MHVMHHTLSALLFYDHATFLGVNRLLSDLLDLRMPGQMR
jgi:hypothetical protein